MGDLCEVGGWSPLGGLRLIAGEGQESRPWSMLIPSPPGGGAGIGRDKPVMRKLRGRPDHWRSNHTHTVTHSYTHTRVQVQLFTMDFDEKEMMPTMRDWMPQTPMTWKT